VGGGALSFYDYFLVIHLTNVSCVSKVIRHLPEDHVITANDIKFIKFCVDLLACAVSLLQFHGLSVLIMAVSLGCNVRICVKTILLQR